jgi:hypothetical protein
LVCVDLNETSYRAVPALWRLAYHSRYTLRSGQPVLVFRRRQYLKTFCDRFGTAFYDLKTPEEKVQRAIQQGLEGLCPEAVATELVEGAARKLASDCWPLWSSDGWKPYLFALTVVFVVLIHFIKGKGRGRPKDSHVVPDPRVRYRQVIKQRAGRRLVAVTRRVVFGLAELIPLKQISTSLLERLNGTIRQHVAPLHRKTRSFAKCRTALNTQTQLFKSYYNLCRKHSTLKGETPAQAAGLSVRSWTLRELLTFKAAIISKTT